jgi:hypothetical protein
MLEPIRLPYGEGQKPARSPAERTRRNDNQIRNKSSPLKREIFRKSAALVRLSLIGASIALLGLAIYPPVLIYPAITNHELNQLDVHGPTRISIQDERFTLQNNARTALIQIFASIIIRVLV